MTKHKNKINKVEAISHFHTSRFNKKIIKNMTRSLLGKPFEFETVNMNIGYN